MSAIDQLPEADKVFAEAVVRDVMDRLDGQPYYILIAIGRDLLAFSILSSLYWAGQEGATKQTTFYRAALKLVDALYWQVHRYFEQREQDRPVLEAIDRGVTIQLTHSSSNKKITH